MGVTISGVGGAIPGNWVSNDALSQRVNTTNEWIVTRTGIGGRFHASEGMSTSDLAIAAAERAFDSAGSNRDVDLLLLATTTPDRRCPATAPKVAFRLGLGEIPALDISAVCSGFIYALQLAGGMLRSGQSRRALVIGADLFSTILDPADRTTLPIFGDGAGAVILEATDHDRLFDVQTGSDGSNEDLITIRGGGTAAHLNASLAGRDDPYFRMAGQAVFQKAVETMARSIKEVLQRNSMLASELDHLVAHQANLRILRLVGEMLDIANDKVVVALDRYGNTSAASIPLALADAHHRNLIAEGSKLALATFGGGLTWGAALVTWPTLHAQPSVATI